MSVVRMTNKTDKILSNQIIKKTHSYNFNSLKTAKCKSKIIQECLQHLK